MTSERDHDSAYELIPWLVNGRLAPDERRSVERHVHSCVTCRRAVEQERRLSSLLAAQSDRALATDAGYRRLVERIERGDRNDEARRFGGRPTIGRTTAWAAAAAIVAAVGLALALGPILPVTTDPPYRTLTESMGDAPAAFDIVFDPAVTDGERDEVFASIEAHDIVGPTSLGRYTVQVGNGMGGSENIERVLEALRRDPRVRFAGRAFGGAEP